MTYLPALLVFLGCFFLMAVGVVFAKKVLQKGCSTDPDSCACKNEGKPSLEDSDELLKHTQFLKPKKNNE